MTAAIFVPLRHTLQSITDNRLGFLQEAIEMIHSPKPLRIIL
jgi:hypothetical protein